MKSRFLAFGLVLLGGPATAQQVPYAPIVINEITYNALLNDIGNMAMPRIAHRQLMEIFEQLRRQAAMERAASDARPKQAEPDKPPEQQ